jgi:DNA-binding CsgD family transcriptional regulator
VPGRGPKSVGPLEAGAICGAGLSAMAQLSEWPMQARQATIAQIIAALGATSDGVVVAGGPGVGKTRVLHAVVDQLVDSGRPVCWPDPDASPGAPAFASWLGSAMPGDAAGIGAMVRQMEARLVEAGNGEPVVLLIDDAHAIDPAGSLVLGQLVVSGRIRALLAVRSGVPVPESITGLWKDGRAQRLDLTPLSLPDTTALLDAADIGLESASVRDLWSRSGGNPALLRELVADGLARGTLLPAGRRTGVSGSDQVASAASDAALRRLPPAESTQRAALEILALAEPVAAWLASRVVLPAELEALEEAGLIMCTPGPEGDIVRLSHPLHRELLRQELTSEQARTYWERLAAAAGQTSHRIALADEVFWRLSGGVDTPVELIEQAARGALRSSDPVTSLRLAQAAVDRGARTAGVLALESLAALDRWAEIPDQMASLPLDELGGRDRARLLVVLYRLALRTANHQEVDTLLDGAVPPATSKGSDAAIVSDTVEALRASTVLARQGDAWRSGQLADRLLARDDMDALPQRSAVAVSMWSHALQGHSGITAWQRSALLKVGFDPATGGRAAEHRGGAAPPPMVLPYLLTMLWEGDLESALIVIEGYRRAAVSGRDGMATSIAVGCLGLHSLTCGQLDKAHAFLEDATGALDRSDPYRLLPLFSAELARAAAGRGDDAGARRALALAGERPETSGLFGPMVARAAAWVTACRDDAEGTAEAAAAAAAAAEVSRRLGQGSVEAMALHDLVRMGRPEPAVERLNELARDQSGALVRLYAAHARALHAGSAVDLEIAAAAFEQAGAFLLGAEAWVQAATVRQSEGSRRAQRSDARGRELARTCGDARTPALQAPPLGAGLSRRETEILELARAGCSTAEIAERCSLSRRTVENHLYRAYEKLGIRGRSELTATPAPGPVRGADR